jgi:hypothetical protein
MLLLFQSLFPSAPYIVLSPYNKLHSPFSPPVSTAQQAILIKASTINCNQSKLVIIIIIIIIIIIN